MVTDGEKGKIRAGKALWMIAALVVVVAGLKAAQGFFVPVLIAFFIATVSFPLLNFLREKRVPRAIAVLLTVAFDFIFLAALGLLAITLIGDLQEKWNMRYASETSEYIRESSKSLALKLEEYGVPDAQEKINDAVNNNVSNLQDIRFEKIWDLGTGLLGRVVGFLGTSLITLVLTIFMLSEARMFGRRLEAISLARGPNLARMLNATRDIQRYLAIKTAISLLTGVLAGFLCYIAGLDFFVLWGILAFFFNFIPVIGSIIAGVPPTILALLVAGAPNAVLVAGGYLLINNFLGNFVEPMLVGRRFGISTLIVIVSVLFWGWLWGPLGMLLAIPLTMVLKVILEGSDEFRWIGVAISAEQPGVSTEKTLLEVVPPSKATEVEPPNTPEGGDAPSTSVP
ncbi:MAG: AI-2E family transporter [Akkermansiaceae bacterium]|jgi:AI-2 transport protein TqsA|nr:AI-2E family transporter [Akkermansiaceae bacterium]MDP4645935.1 AI-2E family transporter [Akkermansiaceae bacterium]MDP4722409.1 AI-2E family transporter [Akkermansiaceae bacterium]MDP4781144.1 AI-2E family transporter [Akkermansiaceae bacterium]MDP4848130.1 AI-2E family transporter [Akkermansiaceae bacterium]